jgi:hypothetical protein
MLVISGSYHSYQSWNMSYQLTDVRRGESLLCVGGVTPGVHCTLYSIQCTVYTQQSNGV